MCDVAGWPVGAGAEVCAKTVPTPIAEERSIALTSDFILNSFSNDDAPHPDKPINLPLLHSTTEGAHCAEVGCGLSVTDYRSEERHRPTLQNRSNDRRQFTGGWSR